MENAVCEFEKTVKNVGNKLNNITWKLNEFEKGVLNVVKNRNSTKMVSVMDLIEDIMGVKTDFQALRNEVLDVEEFHRDIKHNLAEEVNAVSVEYRTLKNMLKITNIAMNNVKE